MSQKESDYRPHLYDNTIVDATTQPVLESFQDALAHFQAIAQLVNPGRAAETDETDETELSQAERKVHEDATKLFESLRAWREAVQKK